MFPFNLHFIHISYTILLGDFMNFQKELELILEKEKNRRPKLLLHVCCSPCSTYVLDYLNKYFDITLYFYNPNIDTKEEFTRRYDEVEKLIKEYPVSVIKIDYDHNEFLVVTKGLERYSEGSLRCISCFKLRLESAFKYALKEEFDYITTTLTISPYKNANIINEIGRDFEKKFNVRYLYSDFKKKDGYKKSIELSKKFGLYRQDYCGCEFSIRKKELDEA